MRFEPGHYCGNNWGYSIRIQNWLVADYQKGKDGYSAGSVIDFSDIERLYKSMIKYKKSHKRRALKDMI